MAEVDINRVFTCHHCLAEFAGRKRKYCSPTCREEHAKPSYQHECQFCQKPFEGRKKKYCSQRCQCEAKKKADRMRRPVKRKEVDCAGCGNSFISAGSLSKYCSKSCRRLQEKGRRNYQIERISAAANKGEFGPPTYSQWLERVAPRKSPSLHPSERAVDRVAEQNGRQAWSYLVKVRASNEWCCRYFKAIKKPWLNPRLSDAERYRMRYKLDSQFQAKERMRRQVKKAEQRNGIADLMRGAIKRNGRSPSVEKRLGYSIKDLCAHLEKQFDKRMNWDLFMQGLIHIDHITPQAKFDLKDQDEWAACWALSNLRPCWAKENLEKGDKLLFLL